MTKETGGPAFPVAQELDRTGAPRCEAWGGMTLRDYFAAKELSKADGCGIHDAPEAYERVAKHCYRMADAMLKAREQ